MQGVKIRWTLNRYEPSIFACQNASHEWTRRLNRLWLAVAGWLWLAGWLPACLPGCLPGWLAGRGWPRLAGWLAGWLAEAGRGRLRLAGRRLAGWMAGWLAAWPAGWLARTHFCRWSLLIFRFLMMDTKNVNISEDV